MTDDVKNENLKKLKLNVNQNLEKNIIDSLYSKNKHCEKI